MRSLTSFSKQQCLLCSCCFLSWLLLACGSVGEPLPPLLNIPERSEGLHAKQTVDGIVLSWVPPIRTTEAMPLREKLRFAIYELALNQSTKPISVKHFESASREVTVIESPTPNKLIRGARLSITLNFPHSQEGVFVYGVLTNNQANRSNGFSDLATVEIVEGPEAPSEPIAKVSSDGIIVKWKSAARASTYQILRRSNKTDPLIEIGMANTTRFLDKQFTWDTPYTYLIRSARRTSTGLTEGPLSPSVEVFAHDIFPPKPPHGLTVVPLESRVDLSWHPNTEPDFSGYRIYRRTSETSTVVINGDTLVRSARFTDRSIAPKTTYHYTITAVDQKGNESHEGQAVRTAVP